MLSWRNSNRNKTWNSKWKNKTSKSPSADLNRRKLLFSGTIMTRNTISRINQRIDTRGCLKVNTPNKDATPVESTRKVLDDSDIGSARLSAGR